MENEKKTSIARKISKGSPRKVVASTLENQEEVVLAGTTNAIPSPLDSSTSSKQSDDFSEKENSMPTLKIMPVKRVVLFPHNVIPLTAGKEWAIEAIDKSTKQNEPIGLVAFKKDDADFSSISTDDLYTIGTEARILKVIRFPDNSYGALLQGTRRFKIIEYTNDEHGSFAAKIEYFEDSPYNTNDLEFKALGKAMKQLVQKAISLSPHIPSEINFFVDHIDDPSYLCDLVIPYLSVDFSEKQMLLECDNLQERLKKVHYFLTSEIEILEITNKINSDVKSEMGKQQRKYFVREQMKLLQKELGEMEGKSSSTSSGQDLNQKIEQSKMSKEAREAVDREMERLSMMQPGAPEYMVSHNYVNWILDLPWETFSHGEINLKNAEKILDEDHYGLKKVKKRIVEFLSVCALKGSLKGPILLFVGPPGVGKTSLGKSIARALGRKFGRIALGGVRDEAEIRGHRRTYVGSMPGKIADTLKKTGVMDPVILFDEIDKLVSDGRGDPSSALLEVLDPEQNNSFTDHYLSIPLDLSKVFFIATANNLYSIPPPLRDRMEIIELSSYTIEEKNHIAFDHILPQVLEEHGLQGKIDVKFSEETMKKIIDSYTREAGVRQLKRELAGIIRGITKDFVEEKQEQHNQFNLNNKKNKNSKKTSTLNYEMDSYETRVISFEKVREYLGAENFQARERPENLPIGVCTGLAWTPVGGDVLLVETVKLNPGSGKIQLTGQLGDVMKESVHTAFAFIKSHAKECSVNSKLTLKNDIHMHFPEGAVKKDGPSAGTAVFCAMVSLFSGKPIASNLAMTGEISLRGEVLPVGGVKEKVLAAHRYGIKYVLIPEKNKKDLEEIPTSVLSELRITCVSTLNDVFKEAFPSVNKSKKKSNTQTKRK